MTKKQLKTLVAEGLSQNQIADRLECSQTNVRYWLRKYDLKTVGRRSRDWKCKLCGKDANRKLCQPCRIKVRRYRAKSRAVELLGGKCARCGWSGNHVAFDFHHVTGVKEFAIGEVSHKRWEVIKAELKKCELLCIRCHKLAHARNTDEAFLKEVEEYQGRELA